MKTGTISLVHTATSVHQTVLNVLDQQPARSVFVDDMDLNVNTHAAAFVLTV